MVTGRRRPINKDFDPEKRRIALRTSFVSRFIVLREGRRSRAHRKIEQMEWDRSASAEELRERFLAAFRDNGDKLDLIERDLRRAYDYASNSVDHFILHYVNRSTLTFQDALDDYIKSNELLFGSEDEEKPREGGWRLKSNGSK